VAVERNSPVRAVPVVSDKIAELCPQVKRFVDKGAYLITDENRSHKEYARGDIHKNTAESFSAILERAKQGVFYYLSKKHLSRYLNEIGFRWDHRIPELRLTKKRTHKLVLKPMPVVRMLKSLLCSASGRQLRRSLNGGFLRIDPV
jgi:hypothetical protein